MSDFDLTIETPPGFDVQLSSPPDISVQLGAQQGHQGIPGPAGGQLNAEAGSTLNGHRAVAIAADGRLQHASADNPDHAIAVAGVIEQAATVGDVLPVRSSGVIEFAGWSWAPGPVMLGLDGQLTQSLPPEAVFEQTIGRGQGTRLVVDLQPPIDL